MYKYRRDPTEDSSKYPSCDDSVIVRTLQKTHTVLDYTKKKNLEAALVNQKIEEENSKSRSQQVEEEMKEHIAKLYGEAGAATEKEIGLVVDEGKSEAATETSSQVEEPKCMEVEKAAEPESEEREVKRLFSISRERVPAKPISAPLHLLTDLNALPSQSASNETVGQIPIYRDCDMETPEIKFSFKIQDAVHLAEELDLYF